ncbi:hypothetical protein FKP32DRAFT_430086 [Trametes sanguinea]|nr:hypothetical protein FKP32DRAFT_430086 [Trametes sanguinea]
MRCTRAWRLSTSSPAGSGRWVRIHELVTTCLGVGAVVRLTHWHYSSWAPSKQTVHRSRRTSRVMPATVLRSSSFLGSAVRILPSAAEWMTSMDASRWGLR